MVKEPTCQCRRHRRHGFDPWVGKISWRRKWQPMPVFLPENFYGQRSLAGYSPWSHKEPDMTMLTCSVMRTYIYISFPLPPPSSFPCSSRPLFFPPLCRLISVSCGCNSKCCHQLVFTRSWNIRAERSGFKETERPCTHSSSALDRGGPHWYLPRSPAMG